jgi:two-component system sensor histidine kinase UhpB
MRDSAFKSDMLLAEWLPVIMQGPFSEIYVMACDTLRFVQVNQAALTNLQFEDAELADKTLLDIARNLTLETLTSVLLPLRNGELHQSALDVVHVRKDGTSYPIEFQVFICSSKTLPVFIAIGSDTSFRHEAAKALRLSESLFRAIVSNTPGLVFQFLRRVDGSVAFPYLGEGCPALLGISAERLREDPDLFVELILPEDRLSYVESMEASALDLKAWNWEGRIWIEEWNDIKWINLRATPRVLRTKNVQ